MIIDRTKIVIALLGTSQKGAVVVLSIHCDSVQRVIQAADCDSVQLLVQEIWVHSRKGTVLQ